MKNLDSNKNPGPDKIHGQFLKNCSSSLSKPLSILFRKSYETGTIPSEWKLDNVVPIHKKGSKVDVNNYRPNYLISIIKNHMKKLFVRSY